MAKREFTISGTYQYKQSTSLHWIISHVLRYKGYLGGFIVGVGIANLLNATIPRLTGFAFDAIAQDIPDLNRLFQIVVVILAIVVVRGLSDLGGVFSMEVIAKRIERDARDELYLNLLGKSQTFHNRQKVGDIMARAANDVRQINAMMMPGVSLIYDSMMGIIMPLIFIGLLRLELLLAPLCFLVVFYFALRHYMKQLNPVTNAMRHQFGVMNAGLNEAVSGIEVVKVAAQEKQEILKFATTASKYRDHFVKNGQIQAMYLPPLFLAMALAGGFLHGLYLWSNGRLSLGELVAFLGLMGLLRFPTFISIFTFSLVQLGMAGARRILDLLQEETEIDENEIGYDHPMRGELIFENVSFGYDDNPVLKNISFRAEPGQTVAIVGQTGSGKSTLTNLVNRTYDITAGRVLIDGQDVRDWNLAGLRSQISTIEQDIFLFSRSIAQNIGFGLGTEFDQQAIEKAAHEAQAHDFITTFKDGYETVIGERGVTLSGGQRQRLAISRALLTDPRILILDDATSAIDSATEDKIQTAIERVLAGRTTLLITHRLSQIKRADKILVLRQGTLIDEGSHNELLHRCELYQRIFARTQLEVAI